MSTKTLTRGALVAALYVVLTLIVPGVSYGPIQFRFSEVLTLLSYFNPTYIPALTLGCFISNIWSPFKLDMIFGTLHTFISVYAMSKSKNIYIASLMPALFSFIIGFEIVTFSPEVLSFLGITGSIMLSEFIIVSVIGIMVFKVLTKNKTFRSQVLMLEKEELEEKL